MRDARWFITLLLMPMLLTPATATAQGTTQADGKRQVAVFRLHGPLQEAPREFDLAWDMEPRHSLFDLLRRFRQAQDDPSLKAVVLTFDKPSLGWGQMQEMRAEIVRLREAGKDVYCYIEDASSSLYLLTSVASKVVMTPTGMLNLLGLHVDQAYFKGLLDKLQLEADVVQIGSYKAAAEPFTRTAPSDEAREMIEWLVDDLFEQMVGMIAKARDLPAERVRQLIDQGPFHATQALEAGLVDELAHTDTFVESIRERHGRDITFAHDYGKDEQPELDFSNLFRFFQQIGQMMNRPTPARKDAVAVIYVNGMIVTGRTEQSLFGEAGSTGSTTVRRALDRAVRDDSIKAIVLRVDSPGGSALASDIIWHAAREADKAKPVVASMGNLAASGGYYVSTGGRQIVADPGTITGSIGVFGGKLVTRDLWGWVGLTFHETQRGRNADLYSSARPFDERQRQVITGTLERIYDEFKDRVAQSRGDRLTKEIEELAGGRVFTGRQAMEGGLVDHLGGLEDAIRLAAAEADIDAYEVRMVPEPRSFLDLFIRGLTGQKDEKDERRIDVGHDLKWTFQAPTIREMLPLLEGMDPLRASAILRSLMRIELLARENVLLALPAEIVIR